MGTGPLRVPHVPPRGQDASPQAGLRVWVARRTKTPLLRHEIALKAGKAIGRYKMGKHCELIIEDGRFEWSRNEESIEREATFETRKPGIKLHS